MDAKSFDALTKTLSTTGTRRGVARLVGSLSLGGALSVFVGGEALAAKRIGGAPCTKDRQCKTGKCAGTTGQKTCSCSQMFPKCKQPTDPCQTAACDSTAKRCVTTNTTSCTEPKVQNPATCACECPTCNPGQTVTNADSCSCTCGSSETFCRQGELSQGSPETCFTCPDTFEPSTTQTCVCECPAETFRRACRTSEDRRTGTHRCCGSSQVCLGTTSGNDACVECPSGTIPLPCPASTGETDETRCCRPDQTCVFAPLTGPRCID